MRKLLITGAGGSPAVNFTRSLRDAPEQFYLVGTDVNPYYLQRAEVDKKYLVPQPNDPLYIPILNEIIIENKLEFIHAQNDAEIGVISENREKLKIKTLLPSKETVRICLDKFTSHKKWIGAGINQPNTYQLNSLNDLKKAFVDFGGKLWIRDIVGAGGRGSIFTEEFEEAKSWLDFKKGWGKYTASEYLSPRSVTWQSIWHNGKLIVAQGRERLYWEFAKISPSGVSGVTGSAKIISDEKLDETAQKAILAIDLKSHGIFSVDLTYDKAGKIYPTEINIGRFFTTHYFFTKLGLNMPYIYVKLALGEEVSLPSKKLNPLQGDYVWIRGVDFLPLLTNQKQIKEDKEKLTGRLKKLNELK